jgi:phage shock protein C
MSKRLTRSKNGAMLGGVCMGLGQYLTIDPVFIRIFFILLTISTGFGLLIYLILWIVIPRDDQIPADGSTMPQPSEFGDRARLMGDEMKNVASKSNPKLPLYIGIGLLVLGGFALLRALPFGWVQYIDKFMWPFLLVLAGIVLLTRGSSKGA